MLSPIYSTIVEISCALSGKKISPSELIQAHLDRIHQLNPKLNAFTHLDEAAALAQARLAERKFLHNEPLGPLEAIPLTIKSCIDVKSWPTPAGSLLRKNVSAPQDATLVARLKSAGAILLGNTNTPEFLMHYETNNLLQGRTSNPWNLAYSAGGSSGGESAAISSGCSQAGIGSDGGGSVRVPAHFCGICGLKPTPGRVPSNGHFPAVHELFPWLGAIGPMARTVEDLQTIFEVIAEPSSGIPQSPTDTVKYISMENLRRTRVGILEAENTLGRPSEETQAALEQAAKLLEQCGFAVAPFHSENFADLLDEALGLWWFFFGPAVAHLYRNDYSGQESQFSPMLKDYFRAAEASGTTTETEIKTNSALREILQKKILQALENVEILLSPVCLAPAFRHGAGHWRETAGYRATMRHSQWLNLAGLPGLSLPMTTSAAGLPIGIQLIAHPKQEELLLAVGAQLEQARGPLELPPFHL